MARHAIDIIDTVVWGITRLVVVLMVVSVVMALTGVPFPSFVKTETRVEYVRSPEEIAYEKQRDVERELAEAKRRERSCDLATRKAYEAWGDPQVGEFEQDHLDRQAEIACE